MFGACFLVWFNKFFLFTLLFASFVLCFCLTTFEIWFVPEFYIFNFVYEQRL